MPTTSRRLRMAGLILACEAASLAITGCGGSSMAASSGGSGSGGSGGSGEAARAEAVEAAGPRPAPRSP